LQVACCTKGSGSLVRGAIRSLTLIRHF